MPRIPLYNQGQGATQRLATGQLSQRADVGAFTAPGKALAQFGETAGQIAFNFGMAERDKQDRDAVSESKQKFLQDSSEFEKNNRTTNYEEYRDKYGAWKEGWLTRNTQNLSSRRKRLITNEINPLASMKSLDGQNKAFRLSEAKGTDLMNEDLREAINAAGIYPKGTVEHDQALKKMDDIFVRNEYLLRNLKYTRKSANLAITALSYNKGIDGSSNFKQLESLEQKVSQDKTLPFEVKQNINNFLAKKKNSLSVEVFDSTIDQITASDLTYSQMDEMVKAANQNKDITVNTSSGEIISLNGSQNPERLNADFVTRINQLKKEKRDEYFSESSESIVSNTKNDSITSGIKTSKEIYKNFRDKDEADKVVLNAVESMVTEAQNLLSIYQEDPSQVDVNKITDLMNGSMAHLNEKFDGRIPLMGKFGSVGDSARKASVNITKINTELIKLKGLSDKYAIADKAMSDGTYGTQKSLINLTAKDEKKVVNNKMKNTKGFSNQILVLAKNGLTWNSLSDELSTAAEDVFSEQPNLENIQKNLVKFQDMNVRARGTGLVDRHLTSDQIVTYSSLTYLMRDGQKTLQEAVSYLNEASKKDIKVEAKYKSVVNTVKEISSETTSWFGTNPKNTATIQNKVENLSKIYIRVGMDPKQAVELAGEQIINSHINYKGVLIPRSVNMNESNINKYGDAMIKDYANKNNIDIDTLSAEPLNGQVSIWMIHDKDGPNPSVRYTKDQIDEIIKQEGLQSEKEDKERAVAKSLAEQQNRLKADNKKMTEIQKKNQKELSEFFKTDFKFKEKTEFALKEEERLKSIRKANKEYLMKNAPIVYGKTIKETNKEQ